MRTHRNLSVPRAIGLLTLLSACATETGDPASSDAPVIQKTWLSAALAGIEADSYQPYTHEAGVSAQNNQNRFAADWDGLSTTVTGESWSFNLQVRAWGTDSLLEPAGMGEVGTGACLASGEQDAQGDCLERVEIARPGLTEWWENRASGLQQGFVVDGPVAAGDLVVDLTVDGADALVEQADEITLITEDGSVLAYSGLIAWDAAGNDLPVHFEAIDGGMRIRVDVQGAVWPVEIDPTLTSLESNQATAWFGYSVAHAGDVNGDGYDDVIVGAPLYDNGQSNEGRAYVYLGSMSGLSTTASWTAENNQAQSRFGNNVNTAGDVNGDGYDDVVISAPWFDNGQTNEGRIYVYHGGMSGLSATAAWTVESNQDSAFGGLAVAGLGDTNGDGYGEVAVGVPYWDNGLTDEGAVWIYNGSMTGLSTASWSMEGEQAQARYGWAVAGMFDVNGDMYMDLATTAPLYDNGQVNEGRAYVYHGGVSGLGTSTAWTGENNQGASNFGWAVSSAGDVNGDGYDDLITSAYLFDNGQTNEGRAYVYHGGMSGLGSTAAWTAESNQANAQGGYSVGMVGDINGDGYGEVIVGVNLYDNGQTDEGMIAVYYGAMSGLSSSPGYTDEGDQASANLGWAVSHIGDIDGNSFPDFAASAYIYDNGHTDEGAVWVYAADYLDSDADGDPDSTDCDDTDAMIYTGATEVCDGADNDCNGMTDDSATDAVTWYADMDGDGFGDMGMSTMSCTMPTGYVMDDSDCDDADATSYPGATESCDYADNDCDGSVDEGAPGSTWYADMDGDGFGDMGMSTVACSAPAGYVADATDCDDTAATTYPDAMELDNGANDDCDDFVDEDYIVAGDIIISEVTRQPRIGGMGTVNDAQWFEVYNTSSRTVYLSNWYVRRTNTFTTDRFYVDPADNVSIPAGDYVVFCRTDNYETAGVAYPMVCDYQWKDETQASTYVGTYKDNTFVLQRDTDKLQIWMGGNETTGMLIDEVAWYYNATNGYWPRDARFSMSLDPAFLTSTSNDSRSSWCSTTATATGAVSNNTTWRWYDVTTSANDEHGTPGADNYDCP